MGLMCHSRDVAAFKDNELNYRYFMMNRVEVEVELKVASSSFKGLRLMMWISVSKLSRWRHCVWPTSVCFDRQASNP